MTAMNTLILDQTTWDLVLDTGGNIAMASTPYSTSQDVSSALKTFLGEVWYDNTLGVPYFQNILGQLPPTGVLKQYWIDAALQVPDVVQAQVVLESLTNRGLTGQVQFTNTQGQINGVSL